MTGGRLQFDKPIVEPSKWNERIDFDISEDVDDTLDKALRDSGEASPVSYANFAVHFPEREHQKLADAQQQLLDYRSWATLNWWDAVFNRPEISQGTDKESTLARVSRVAEMGESQILQGPCFDLQSHKIETKRITAEKSKIHEGIIREVLRSLVHIPESAIPDLERIFNIIIAAIEAKSQVSDNLAHLNVCNTIEHAMGNIRSLTQTTLFLITYETVQFNTKKGDADHVEFTISYSQARGGFGINSWKSVVEQLEIRENERQAMNGYVEERTVDVNTSFY